MQNRGIYNEMQYLFLVHSSGADLTSLSDYDSAGLQETKNRVLAALRRFIAHRETEPPSATDSPVAGRNDV